MTRMAGGGQPSNHNMAMLRAEIRTVGTDAKECFNKIFLWHHFGTVFYDLKSSDSLPFVEKRVLQLHS